MKVLFITHYFPPESNAPANRTHEHLKEWVEEGDEITVITNFPNHPNGTLYPGYRNAWCREEIIDGIRVVRVWTYLTPNRGVFRRILNYLTFMIMAIQRSLFVERPDVVVITSPQFFTAVAGYVVSVLRRRPFVFELRDIWPESIRSVGAMNHGLFIAVMEKLELFLYRRARLIVSVTDSFVEDLSRRGIDREKIVVVKNGVNLNLFHPMTHPDRDREKAREGYPDKFIVSYIGTIGMAHAVDRLIDVADLLRSHDDIHFVIIGDGAEKANVVKKAEALELKNVSILGQRPRKELRRYYGIADAVVVPLKRKPIFTKVIPSKIFEIMATARPILISVDGEARKIVEEANCGLYSEPEDVEQLKENILTLVDHPALGHELGENGLRYVRKHYDRRRFAGKMREAVRGVIS